MRTSAPAPLGLSLLSGDSASGWDDPYLLQAPTMRPWISLASLEALRASCSSICRGQQALLVHFRKPEVPAL